MGLHIFSLLFICFKQTEKREKTSSICLIAHCWLFCYSSSRKSSSLVQFDFIYLFIFTLPLKQTHRHTSTKAGNSPLGTSGTGKQTALLSVSPFEFSVTASLLKRSTFYYEVEIRISIISSTNPPPPLHGWCTTFTGA